MYVCMYVCISLLLAAIFVKPLSEYNFTNIVYHKIG